MARFREQAICIRHLDWSETSQVVALLTESMGRVRGIAKGSRRNSPSHMQRFSGGIELLTRGEICGQIKPTTDLATLTEWDLQDPMHHLRVDLAAQQFAYFAADLAGALVEDQHPHPRSFHALVATLTELAQPAHRQAAILSLQWTLLDDAGYRPQLDVDVNTGEVLPDDAAQHVFSALQGGLTQAGENGQNAWPVRRETVQLLRQLRDEPLTIADLAEAYAGRDATLQRANRLLCVYARSLLQRELPTMALILGRPATV